MSTYQDAVDEHNPANWSVTSNDGANVIAHNNRTGRDFNGTTEAFNKYNALTIKPPRKSSYDLVSGVETGKEILNTARNMYVRHDGRNGNGLENTPESAFNSLPALLDYIDNTYEIRDPYGWISQPIIRIIMVGTWTLVGTILKLPHSSGRYYAMEIVFENKASNFTYASVVSDPTVYLGIRGVTFRGLSVDFYSCVFISDCVLTSFTKVYHGSYLNLGNCEIKDDFSLAAMETGVIVPYNYLTDSASAILKLTSNLTNTFLTVTRFAFVELDNFTINLNGFNNSGSRFDISNSAHVNRTGDSTKSFLPGTAGVERSNGIYTYQ